MPPAATPPALVLDSPFFLFTFFFCAFFFSHLVATMPRGRYHPPRGHLRGAAAAPRPPRVGILAPPPCCSAAPLGRGSQPGTYAPPAGCLGGPASCPAARSCSHGQAGALASAAARPAGVRDGRPVRQVSTSEMYVQYMYIDIYRGRCYLLQRHAPFGWGGRGCSCLPAAGVKGGPRHRGGGPAAGCLGCCRPLQSIRTVRACQPLMPEAGRPRRAVVAPGWGGCGCWRGGGK